MFVDSTTPVELSGYGLHSVADAAVAAARAGAVAPSFDAAPERVAAVAMRLGRQPLPGVYARFARTGGPDLLAESNANEEENEEEEQEWRRRNRVLYAPVFRGDAQTRDRLPAAETLFTVAPDWDAPCDCLVDLVVAVQVPGESPASFRWEAVRGACDVTFFARAKVSEVSPAFVIIAPKEGDAQGEQVVVGGRGLFDMMLADRSSREAALRLLDDIDRSRAEREEAEARQVAEGLAVRADAISLFSQ